MSYKLVPGSQGATLQYEITCGLQEGYGSKAILHTADEAVAVIEAVLQEQAAVAGNDGMVLSGTVLSGATVYAWPGGSGNEPSITYKGETKPLYNTIGGTPATEEAISGLLTEIASTLGSALGQSRVYCRLGDRVWILQKEETVTPTGETV